MFEVKLTGEKDLNSFLKKMNRPLKFYDSALKKTVRQSLRRLIKETPRRPRDIYGRTQGKGTTAQAWGDTKKISDGVYKVSNPVLTKDKKHAIVEILNKGRGSVFPKKAKRLYIPLSSKGLSVTFKSGGRKKLEFGKDFVYAKKAGPYAGTKFIDKELEKASKELVKEIEKKLVKA